MDVQDLFLEIKNKQTNKLNNHTFYMLFLPFVTLSKKLSVFPWHSISFFQCPSVRVGSCFTNSSGVNHLSSVRTHFPRLPATQHKHKHFPLKPLTQTKQTELCTQIRAITYLTQTCICTESQSVKHRWLVKREPGKQTDPPCLPPPPLPQLSLETLFLLLSLPAPGNLQNHFPPTN